MLWTVLADWQPQNLFLVFAVPAAISAVAMLVMHRRFRSSGQMPS
jgi:hypothetical protein